MCNFRLNTHKEIDSYLITVFVSYIDSQFELEYFSPTNQNNEGNNSSPKQAKNPIYIYEKQENAFKDKNKQPINPLSQQTSIQTEGKDTEELKELIINVNRNAMLQLKHNNKQTAFQMLKTAEEILKNRKNQFQDTIDLKERFDYLLSMTLNNLGCYYKKQYLSSHYNRIKSPQVALHYLKQAQRYEDNLKLDDISKASTLLNICAILSILQRHIESVSYAQRATKILKKKLSQIQQLNLSSRGKIQEEPECEITDFDGNKLIFNQNSISDEDQEIMNIMQDNLVTTLMIAYYNLGVEHEHLTEFQKALEYYDEAEDIGINRLDRKHYLVDQIAKSKRELIIKIEKNTQMKEERSKVRNSLRIYRAIVNNQGGNTTRYKSFMRERNINKLLQDQYNVVSNLTPRKTIQRQLKFDQEQKLIDNMGKSQVIKKKYKRIDLAQNQQMSRQNDIQDDVSFSNIQNNFIEKFDQHNLFETEPDYSQLDDNQFGQNNERYLAFSTNQTPSRYHRGGQQISQIRFHKNRYQSAERGNRRVLDKIQHSPLKIQQDYQVVKGSDQIHSYKNNLRRFYDNQQQLLNSSANKFQSTMINRLHDMSSLNKTPLVNNIDPDVSPYSSRQQSIALYGSIQKSAQSNQRPNYPEYLHFHRPSLQITPLVLQSGVQSLQNKKLIPQNLKIDQLSFQRRIVQTSIRPDDDFFQKMNEQLQQQIEKHNENSRQELMVKVQTDQIINNVQEQALEVIKIVNEDDLIVEQQISEQNNNREQIDTVDKPLKKNNEEQKNEMLIDQMSLKISDQASQKNKESESKQNKDTKIPLKQQTLTTLNQQEFSLHPYSSLTSQKSNSQLVLELQPDKSKLTIPILSDQEIRSSTKTFIQKNTQHIYEYTHSAIQTQTLQTPTNANDFQKSFLQY